MDSLREAMYELIETRDVSEIKVVDLIRKAGVSRGGFYKNYYLVTDVLKDDIKEVSDDVKKAIGPYIENNVVSNWEIILTAVYSYRERIPLLIKAGMGMQILEQMNAGIESKDEQAQLRTHGHQGGDTALCMVAEAIRRALPADGIAARVGGDEFLVFMPGCDDAGTETFKEDFHTVLAKLN